MDFGTGLYAEIRLFNRPESHAEQFSRGQDDVKLFDSALPVEVAPQVASRRPAFRGAGELGHDGRQPIDRSHRNPAPKTLSSIDALIVAGDLLPTHDRYPPRVELPAAVAGRADAVGQQRFHSRNVLTLHAVRKPLQRVRVRRDRVGTHRF